MRELLGQLASCSLATPVHTANCWMPQPPRKEHAFSMALRRAEHGEEDPLLPASAVASGLSNQSWIGSSTTNCVFSVHSPGHAVFDVSTFLYASPGSLLPALASIPIMRGGMIKDGFPYSAVHRVCRTWFRRSQ